MIFYSYIGDITRVIDREFRKNRYRREKNRRWNLGLERTATEGRKIEDEI
jgi:hypothetical protein